VIIVLKKYITASNCITCVRILGSIAMIFLVPCSVAFYIVYSLCGLSDAVDGIVARKTNTVTEFGAKLDSVADMLFYTVMLIKIFPRLLKILPSIVWYFLGAALIIRLASYIVAAIKYKKFASQHTYLNKLTGFAVFAAPYVIILPIGAEICFAITIIGCIASLEELLIHITQSEYFPEQKTIFKISNTNNN